VGLGARGLIPTIFGDCCLTISNITNDFRLCAMGNWLFKTEPHVFSVNDLATAKKQISAWDGIRNYQARNFLRDDVKLNDRVFLYHCQCKAPGIYGIARVKRACYPDPAQFNEASPYYDPRALIDDPRWYCVDIQLEQALTKPLLLPVIKQHSALDDLGIFKQPRLSVVPLTDVHTSVISALIEAS
jgi:predicted RNA-binding protein with PUA-like domain